MSIIGWWLATGSVANFLAGLVAQIAAIWHQEFTPRPWHLYLIFAALIWAAAAFNILGSRLIPIYNQVICALSILTFGSTLITLFVVARHNHASADFILADISGQSGWSSPGFAFFLAVGNAVFGFVGSDCGAHLCEEIANPAKYVPMVILYPIMVGTMTAFPFAAALTYSITDLTAVLNTATGVPLIEIYLQATGSPAAASVLLAVFTFCLFGCLVGIGKRNPELCFFPVYLGTDKIKGTTCSRTLWAVSRDGVLPFSHLWMQVHPDFKMPMNAMLLTATCATVSRPLHESI